MKNSIWKTRSGSHHIFCSCLVCFLFVVFSVSLSLYYYCTTNKDKCFQRRQRSLFACWFVFLFACSLVLFTYSFVSFVRLLKSPCGKVCSSLSDKSLERIIKLTERKRILLSRGQENEIFDL